MYSVSRHNFFPGQKKYVSWCCTWTFIRWRFKEKNNKFWNNMFIKKIMLFNKSFYNNEPYKLKKQNVPSKVSFYLILMDAHPWTNDSLDHELLLTRLKYINCLIQYKSSCVFKWDTFKTLFSIEEWNNVRVVYFLRDILLYFK